MARFDAASCARADRDFQSLLLRGSSGHARAPRAARTGATAAHREARVEASISGYLRVRAAFDQEWRGHSEISSSYLQGGATPAVFGPARRAVQALEVFDGRCRRATALGPLHGS